MAILNISEEIESRLTTAAKRAGRTPESLAEEILSTHLEEDIKLSPEQIARLVESSKQIDRGEYVTSEEVDRFFEDWFRELKAR